VQELACHCIICYSSYCLHVIVNSCSDTCYVVYLQAVHWRLRLKLIVKMLWRLREKLIVMISLSIRVTIGQVSVCFVYFTFTFHDFIHS